MDVKKFTTDGEIAGKKDVDVQTGFFKKLDGKALWLPNRKEWYLPHPSLIPWISVES